MTVQTSEGDHFLVRFSDDAAADGPLVAVKDLIDVAGYVTTAGCKAVAATAAPAERDATCLAGVRAAGARIVGKTALNELAYGVSGTNDWYGTPANPLDAARMPGGSSSGSAVAAALGEASVALGTDTGGSIRIPAACCGVVGLKTTYGSIPLDGVRPLAPSFDTVGPMGRDVGSVVLGYSLLVGAPVSVSPPGTRVARLVGVPDVDAQIDQAVDAALGAAGLEVVEVELPSWRAAFDAHRVILGAEAWQVNGHLLDGLFADPDGVGEEVRQKLERGRTINVDALEAAWQVGAEFRASLAAVLEQGTVLALPTIPCPPPLLSDSWARLVWLTAPINLAGLPALALPVPSSVALPASLQLVGPAGGEAALLALGASIERAVGAR